ncbi:MAG: sensor histidine kinase [Pseudoflavonifractor sp.]
MVLLLLLFAAAAVTAAHTIWMLVLMGLALATVGLGLLAYFLLWRPYGEATRALNALTESASSADHAAPSRCFYNKTCSQLSDRLGLMLKTSNSFELSKRQAQYLALQNQINPHFLYNTLESIRSEALISGMDSVAEMCEALASFFRYTISDQENLVTVEDELQNINTYFYIQQYRFGSRLALKVEYEEGDLERLRRCKIPKLTLQPIVENAIVHGIEQKLGNGTVTVRLTLTERCLLIRISDDGVGMTPEILEKINRRIAGGVSSGTGKGGIAIANVNNRIKLLFGNTYGVTVYSTLGVGTDVEITLPQTP